MLNTSARLPGHFLKSCASVTVLLLAASCGGGGGSGNPAPTDPSNATSADGNAEPIVLDTDPNADQSSAPGAEEGPDAGDGTASSDPQNGSGEVLDPFSDTAVYTVTVRNFWGADDYPQDFPDEAHLSLWGGATHNEAFSLWSVGEPPSRGLEDVAEAGLIDILLFDEVAPAIQSGTADSMVEIRTYTDPAIDGMPGVLEFEVSLSSSHPLLSMVSMLGPSPDWFVGVDSLSMKMGGDEGLSVWIDSMTVPLALFDGGSKSDIIPVMGGPDIIPPDPVSLVAYDPTTGTYLPSSEEQIVAELQFVRTR